MGCCVLQEASIIVHWGFLDLPQNVSSYWLIFRSVCLTRWNYWSDCLRGSWVLGRTICGRGFPFLPARGFESFSAQMCLVTQEGGSGGTVVPSGSSGALFRATLWIWRSFPALSSRVMAALRWKEERRRYQRWITFFFLFIPGGNDFQNSFSSVSPGNRRSVSLSCLRRINTALLILYIPSHAALLLPCMYFCLYGNCNLFLNQRFSWTRALWDLCGLSWIHF